MGQNTSQAVIPEKRQNIDRDRPGKIDAGKAFELRSRGNTLTEIARIMGTSRQAVQQRLKQFSQVLENPESIQVYNQNIDNILSAAQLELLGRSLDKGKIKQATTLQLATAYAIYFDKQRLTRGQSTAIIDHVDLTPGEREQLRLLEARIIDADVTQSDTLPDNQELTI